MFPAFRRTSAAPPPATRSSTGSRFKEARSRHVVRLIQPADETRRSMTRIASISKAQKAEHQAFGAGGRQLLPGNSARRLELKIMFEETLKR